MKRSLVSAMASYLILKHIINIFICEKLKYLDCKSVVGLNSKELKIKQIIIIISHIILYISRMGYKPRFKPIYSTNY